MARVTVEDCLARVGNHFALVILAATRARQIYEGAPVTVEQENRPPVLALREVATGKVRFEESLQNRLEEYLHDLRTRGIKDPVLAEESFPVLQES